MVRKQVDNVPDDPEAAYPHYQRALTAAVALAQQTAPARRLFLPPGLAHFGRIADDSPLTIARAGVLRADSADADRGWELLLLNRWLAEIAPEDPDLRKQRAAFLAAAGEFAQAEELVRRGERAGRTIAVEVPSRFTITFHVSRSRFTAPRRPIRDGSSRSGVLLFRHVEALHGE